MNVRNIHVSESQSEHNLLSDKNQDIVTDIFLYSIFKTEKFYTSKYCHQLILIFTEDQIVNI